MNCISCPMVCKIFFSSEFPVIPEEKKRRRGNYEAFCFSSKRKKYNNIFDKSVSFLNSKIVEEEIENEFSKSC